MNSARPAHIEICILAGGLSSRMGRDKSRMRLGKRSLLSNIRATAKTTKLPLRIIRRDIVARCGPLGGIFTALKTTRADAVLFLACDMPFVSPKHLQQMLESFPPKALALFTNATPLQKEGAISPEGGKQFSLSPRKRAGGRGTSASDNKLAGNLGFPFILRREALPIVERQLLKELFSLQPLARALKAKSFRVSAETPDLFNINTPEDWAKARSILRQNS